MAAAGSSLTFVISPPQPHKAHSHLTLIYTIMNPHTLLTQGLVFILALLFAHASGAPITFRSLALPTQAAQRSENFRVDTPFLRLARHGPEEIHQLNTEISTVATSSTVINQPNIAITGAATSPKNGSFMNTHPIVVILLFILSPFIICAAIYPIYIFIRRRRAAPQIANESAPLEKKDRLEEKQRSAISPYWDNPLLEPKRSPSPYWNNPRLEPLSPKCPELAYMPTAINDPAQSIFGQYHGADGMMHGVTDRWVTDHQGKGIVVEKSSESIMVHTL
ncbi:hypothetical protein K439DRAFT_472063 [Ramaria rubella]|nr:hypothetical protein K439DRAFT_472063 [Ramaria rubella]